MDLGLLFFWEMLGTLVLVAVGTSVNAGVNLKKTYASGSNWLTVAFGWGLGITLGAAVASYSGGAINPAVALGNLIIGTWDGLEFLMAALGEVVGAIIGALLTTLIFWNHFKKEEDGDKVRGIFATGPSYGEKNLSVYSLSFITETFGTFLLVAGLFLPATFGVPVGGPIYAGLLVFGIGASIGSLTGFAINPARDLGPRIVYTIIPFKNKNSSQWDYSFVPIIAPFVGASIAAGITFIA